MGRSWGHGGVSGRRVVGVCREARVLEGPGRGEEGVWDFRAAGDGRDWAMHERAGLMRLRQRVMG